MKKINIFDFDGTLFNTFNPTIGREIYKRAKGGSWPFTGWWSKKESMLSPLEPTPGPAFDDCKSALARSDELTVLMTGRHGGLANIIQPILNRHGLFPDMYFFNVGGATIECKIKQIGQLLKDFPSVITVEMWEDRKNHAEVFRGLNDRFDGVKFIINHVDNGE